LIQSIKLHQVNIVQDLILITVSMSMEDLSKINYSSVIILACQIILLILNKSLSLKMDHKPNLLIAYALLKDYLIIIIP